MQKLDQRVGFVQPLPLSIWLWVVKRLMVWREGTHSTCCLQTTTSPDVCIFAWDNYATICALSIHVLWQGGAHMTRVDFIKAGLENNSIPIVFFSRIGCVTFVTYWAIVVLSPLLPVIPCNFAVAQGIPLVLGQKRPKRGVISYQPVMPDVTGGHMKLM